jgi:hypothetical protein
MICRYEYCADLFVIPMSDIEIILGMDWLVSHGAQIDCGVNTVTIKNTIAEKVVYQGDRNARLEAKL